jgi:hypothetical protein
MIACALVLGACFAVGFPALLREAYVVWGICCLISLPASLYVGRYNRQINPREK